MKKLVLSVISLVFILASCSKDDDVVKKELLPCDFVNYKYYEGKKDYLGEVSHDYILIGIYNRYSDAQIWEFISSLRQFRPDYKILGSGKYGSRYIPVKFNSPKTCEEIKELIMELEHKEMVAYVYYTMLVEGCDNFVGEPMGNLCLNACSEFFYVKVFDENNLQDLKRVMKETNTTLFEQDEFMPKWVVVKTTKNSSGNALEMANYFHKTGLFECAEPDVLTFPVE